MALIGISVTDQRVEKAESSVMVRESLEGAWRDVEPWETPRVPTKVLASVDIVDLTEGRKYRAFPITIVRLIESNPVPALLAMY